MRRQLGNRPVAPDRRHRYLRLERRAVLLSCPLHILLPRYPRFLGAGLHLSYLSQFRGPAQSAQFIRFIDGFDVGYSSDRRTLEGICRGRTLAGQFLNPEEARDIYHAATQAAPNQAYLYQQWAIFETTHPRGNVIAAERLAETAAIM